MAIRYSSHLLFMITAIVASITLCAVNLSQTTFFIGSVMVPVMIALTLRYIQKNEHVTAAVAAWGSAIAVGALLLACGSYDQTFIQKAQGILVGDGWRSVGSAAFFGGFMGMFCGVGSLLIYFVLVAFIVKYRPALKDSGDP